MWISKVSFFEVINIRSLPKSFKNWPEDCVYLGRGNSRLGLPHSPLSNPFKIGPDGNRAEVIKKFRVYYHNRPGLKEYARKHLLGKKGVCWCAPDPCHLDVIAEDLNSDVS